LTEQNGGTAEQLIREVGEAPKAKLPRNQSPAGRRLQMASDGNECAGRGSRRDRDNEAVLSRAVHPEWRTGGAVGRKIAAASRRDHLPCGPLQAARGLQRSGLC